MMSKALGGALFLFLLTGAVRPAPAQDIAADVRTWSGESVRLSQPYVTVGFTIMPQTPESPLPPPGAKTVAAATSVRIQGDPKELKGLFESAVIPTQSEREMESLTLYQGGLTHRISVSKLVSLAFMRQPVVNSPLPPHVAAAHFRYSAIAVLTDGSRIEGDYVDMGTAMFNGVTPDGRVSIPWRDIESLRFVR